MAVVQTLIGNVKGPQGETGATGPQGAQGEAATINVGTVSTTAYGNAAQVTNVGTESDAVLNFVIPQGKPGEKTTTMGGLTLDTITTQTADYPVPAVGDTGATAFGKIVKWFSDALTAITGKLDKSHVTDSLTVTHDGYALDAKVGKVLNDRIATAPQFVKGAYTGSSTKSTFAFLDIGGARRPWLIFGNGRLAILEFTNSLTNFQFTVVVGSNLTATSVGENKVEITGFEYYDNPIAISLRN